jgi:uncharacterized protein YgbK (DUF1537 family)
VDKGKAKGAEAPLIGWLGDDVTGAAAVMEVLTFGGLPSILFLGPPTAEQLARYPDVKGVGIATLARTKSPDWMDENLPGLFATLADTGAGLIHYKTCSTLDSAPHIGSIGRAMDIGAAMFGRSAIPVVLAAPAMRRYQAFGHLFAGTPEGVFRLDRHPVMARHPVTPMDEADVARHLARQSDMPFQCLDLEMQADPEAAAARLSGQWGGWTMDMMTARDEPVVGRLLWERRESSRFVVGSQGVEYALAAHLAALGQIPPVQTPSSLGRTDNMAIVAGSVSPITRDQINWAEGEGFASIAFDTLAVCRSPDDLSRAEDIAVETALSALSEGRIPLVHSAKGPDDPRVAALTAQAADMEQANEAIGGALGRILLRLVTTARLRRAVVAGGDTSGHVTGELGIFALSALVPTIPGAAICSAQASGAADGLEIALKGGQMGSHDYFGWIRDGGGLR